jgi:hypothetical protein
MGNQDKHVSRYEGKPWADKAVSIYLGLTGIGDTSWREDEENVERIRAAMQEVAEFWADLMLRTGARLSAEDLKPGTDVEFLGSLVRVLSIDAYGIIRYLRPGATDAPPDPGTPIHVSDFLLLARRI